MFEEIIHHLEQAIEASERMDAPDDLKEAIETALDKADQVHGTVRRDAA